MSKVKSKIGDKAKDPNYQQVGIYITNDAHLKAKVIAAYRSENLRDFIGDAIEKHIDLEYAKVLEEQNALYQKQQQEQYNEEIVNQ